MPVAKPAAKKVATKAVPAKKVAAKKAEPPALKTTTSSKKTDFKLPKKLDGSVADQMYELRAARLAAQKVVTELEEKEKALKAWIIDNLSKSSTGISGKTAHVKIVPKEIPQVTDWPKLYAYIKKNDRFDLLQRRVLDGAITEIWENGKKVPGVEKFDTKTISLTKV